jgi:N utilization substance protein A
VDISEETKTARVVVPERQLSLAIGKEGQNARLAAKLTGWRIDIRSDTPPAARGAESAPAAAAPAAPPAGS